MLHPAKKGSDWAQLKHQKVLRAMEGRVCECSQAKSTNQTHHYTLKSSPLVPSTEISFIMGRWRKSFTFVKELTV